MSEGICMHMWPVGTADGGFRCQSCKRAWVPYDAIARARREALEEAAKMLEEVADACVDGDYRNACDENAAAIRALSDTPKAPETDGET